MFSLSLNPLSLHYLCLLWWIFYKFDYFIGGSVSYNDLGHVIKNLFFFFSCFADYLKLLLANDYNYGGSPTKIVQILDLSPANKTCSTLQMFPDSGKKFLVNFFCNWH